MSSATPSAPSRRASDQHNPIASGSSDSFHCSWQRPARLSLSASRISGSASRTPRSASARGQPARRVVAAIAHQLAQGGDRGLAADAPQRDDRRDALRLEPRQVERPLARVGGLHRDQPVPERACAGDAPAAIGSRDAAQRRRRAGVPHPPEGLDERVAGLDIHPVRQLRARGRARYGSVGQQRDEIRRQRGDPQEAGDDDRARGGRARRG